MDKIHLNFKGKINPDTYDILEQMYSIGTDGDCSIDESIREKVLRNEEFIKLEKADIRLKIKIFYQRYCILIKELIKEYNVLSDDERKETVDYYLFDNRLKELNYLGLGFYYNCKFKKTQATLFRSDGKTIVTPICYNEYDGVLVLKEVFNYCREHINKGNNKVILRSYSKCFGTVLFKYLSIIDGNKSVRLCIRPKSDINVIIVDDVSMSLQKYINSQQGKSYINFCIDISSARNGKRDNLTLWMKNFLGEKSCEIQKLLSPVSDKEVIMSFIPVNELYLEFEEDELMYLLYRYYRKFYEVHNKSKADKFDENFNNLIEELKKVLSENLNSFAEEDKTQRTKNAEQYINRIESYIENPKKLTMDKINTVFDYINWDEENLNIDKDIESVYKNETSNSNINTFKLLLHKYLMNM